MSRPDNNIFRVMDRASRNGAEVLCWLAINQDERKLTFVDHEDYALFDRQNNVGIKWFLSPVYDRTIVDYNGNPAGSSTDEFSYDEGIS